VDGVIVSVIADEITEMIAPRAAPKTKNVRNFGVRRTVTFSVLDFSLTLLFSPEVERKEFANVGADSGCANRAHAHSDLPRQRPGGQCNEGSRIHLDDVGRSSSSVTWSSNELDRRKWGHANLHRVTGRRALENLKQPTHGEREFGSVRRGSPRERVGNKAQSRTSFGVSNSRSTHESSLNYDEHNFRKKKAR